MSVQIFEYGNPARVEQQLKDTVIHPLLNPLEVAVHTVERAMEEATIYLKRTLPMIGMHKDCIAPEINMVMKLIQDEWPVRTGQPEQKE